MTLATVGFPPCQRFAFSGILGTSRTTRMKQNQKSLHSLAAELAGLKAKAKALGVVTDDRELLTCPRCGLAEDVTCDGLLITCISSALGEDTGLRFEAASNDQFRCPTCGSILK